MRNLLRLLAVAGALIWAPFAYAQAVVSATSSGQSGQATCSATCNGSSLIPSTDTASFLGVLVIQFTTYSGTAGIAFQQSEDNATWNFLECSRQTSNVAGVVYGTVSTATNGVVNAYTCQPVMRYVRVFYTSYSSGTQSIFWDFRPGITQPVDLIPGVNYGQPLAANGTGTTGAVTAAIASPVSRIAYLCGFTVTTTASGGSSGPITITGLLGGTQTYQAPAQTAGVVLQQQFTPCIPATAGNSTITLTTTANATATAVNALVWGYTL